jgi:uncharacterized membrane protein YfhO
LGQSIKARVWQAQAYLWVHTWAGALWVIGISFVYSRYINPRGSMYLERYFFILVPHVLLLAAFALKCLGELIQSKRSLIYLAVFFALIGLPGYYKAISGEFKLHQPYREVAELLAQKEET